MTVFIMFLASVLGCPGAKQGDGSDTGGLCSVCDTDEGPPECPEGCDECRDTCD